MKQALITGITGQDGAYLAQFLLNKDYRIYGAFRKSSSGSFWRLDELGILNHPQFTLIEMDLADAAMVLNTVRGIMPDEIYNLAAQSSPGESFANPIATAQSGALGTLRLLESIRILNPQIRFFQASSSDMFGNSFTVPATEATPFHPVTPYGVTKLYAHWLTINYRESYNIFASCGILFNHESPLRGKSFVTRKITDGLAKIFLGKLDVLELGNLDANRDWGYAKEYVEGMWKIMQHHTPDSYILATGNTATVRDFVTLAANSLGMPLKWRGKGIDEVAENTLTGKICVRVNPSYFRPSGETGCSGNPARAMRELGWKTSISIDKLAKIMTETDLARNRAGK